ncbi:MAG: hypothetical protein M3040_02780 [Bacteroidota bacterium]|nr:hypothetical protein [Bacteroidota bacterium]
MKKLVVLVLLLAAIAGGVGGCKKIIDSIFSGVDADVPEVTFNIPYVAVPAGTPVPTDERSIGTLTQSFDLDSTIRAKTNGQFGAGDVTSVKIKQIVMNMPNADDQNNFSNFESARFTFASNAGQNTPELEVASFMFPQANTSTMTYVAPDNAPELRPYLNGNKLTYNVYGKLRRFTTKALTVGVKVTMKIK